jgi:hypothetical protein
LKSVDKMRLLHILLVVAVATVAGSRRNPAAGKLMRFKAQIQEQAAKATPGGGCGGLGSCGSCTSISFCMWHVHGGCHADTSVKSTEVYNYYKGNCNQLAGDWTDVGGVASHIPKNLNMQMKGEREEDTYNYHPLMMQPPAIANQDEAHIFQGPYPKPDYGKGELGYKLHGLDPNMNRDRHADKDPMNTPRHECAGDPLSGCLEKPVIVPVGVYSHNSNGHTVREEAEQGSPAFRQRKAQPKPRKPIDRSSFVKPVWNENYDDKDDLDKNDDE